MQARSIFVEPYEGEAHGYFSAIVGSEGGEIDTDYPYLDDGGTIWLSPEFERAINPMEKAGVVAAVKIMAKLGADIPSETASLMDEPLWLQKMPAVPLISGVPIIASIGPRRQVRATWTEDGPAGQRPVYKCFISGDKWRIDLEHPLGFAYAIQVIGNRIRKIKEEATDAWELLGLHQWGILAQKAILGSEVTDEERERVADFLNANS